MAGMFDFKKMLSVARRADATSADVQTALVKAKAAAEAARGDIAEAKDRYIRVLLEDDFQASVKAKESEARAEIERDRAHALIEVLEKQLSGALAREQQAADAITAETGRKAAVEYRRIIEEIYAPAAKAAAEALAKLPELQKKSTPRISFCRIASASIRISGGVTRPRRQSGLGGNAISMSMAPAQKSPAS